MHLPRSASPEAREPRPAFLPDRYVEDQAPLRFPNFGIQVRPVFRCLETVSCSCGLKAEGGKKEKKHCRRAEMRSRSNIVHMPQSHAEHYTKNTPVVSAAAGNRLVLLVSYFCVAASVCGLSPSA